MSNWIEGSVIEVRHWTNTLFSLRTRATVMPFTAGQFVKLALEIDGARAQRAYSYVNAPQDPVLEFYLVLISGGKLSTALHALQPGDPLLMTPKAAGFFVLDEVPSCETLWMLATGTAIGPYLSILQDGRGLARFSSVVLVHGVRHVRDLSYWPLMQQLQQRYGTRLQLQAVVSRETMAGALLGRIPALIASGALEAAVGCQLSASQSHVMLCGNPEMVRDTQQLLQTTRGMQRHLRRQPGHITSERYW